jgi:hypothetical protein
MVPGRTQQLVTACEPATGSRRELRANAHGTAGGLPLREMQDVLRHAQGRGIAHYQRLRPSARAAAVSASMWPSTPSSPAPIVLIDTCEAPEVCQCVTWSTVWSAPPLPQRTLPSIPILAVHLCPPWRPAADRCQGRSLDRADGPGEPCGLDYWITSGRTGGLGSSWSDHFGCLPACTPSAGLPDGADPAPDVQGRRALGTPARERSAAPPDQPGPLPASRAPAPYRLGQGHRRGRHISSRL